MNAAINTERRPLFPFTAVAGQADFKLALILTAINPAIGGVLIAGPRGSAKSTLARGLADVMAMQPVDGKLEAPAFVTLPLGSSEEMLVGTMNLQQVLDQQQVSFQPGLLARADGGVLYVDEVNLLTDNLVDLLLDVAASGRNVIERDGISHSHSAQFILLGTMNPDEGELREQLQDRFGLSVHLANQYSIDERMEIVRLREAFERAPQAFLDQWQQAQQQLRHAIVAATALLPQLQCSDALRRMIAERCQQAAVDGLRADIIWLRAALAHAAFEGHSEVLERDVLAVEELVLAHRRKHHHSSSSQPPTPPSGQAGDDSAAASPPTRHAGQQSPPFSRPDNSHAQNREQNIEQSPPEATDGNEAGEEGDQQGKDNQPESRGDWGSMTPVQQRTAVAAVSLPRQKASALSQHLRQKLLASSARLGTGRAGAAFGRGNPSSERSSKVDWFQSLLASAGRLPLAALRFRPHRQGQVKLHLVLLDTSASTLQRQLFAQSKACVLEIAEQAYVAREQLAIMGFGNQSVELLLAKRRPPKSLRPFLDQIPACGGTPLREMLQQALQYQQQWRRQNPGIQFVTYLITDGRTNQRLDDLTLLQEVMVIDIEQSAVKRGRAAELAQCLDAHYFSLAGLTRA